MPFEFTKLVIPEVILIKPATFADGRGFFREIYKRSEFVKGGITEHFVQDNHSMSARFVLRGLHYQKHPSAQGKLIYCLKGKIFDVAVDIRRGSPTYAKWVGVELSEDNKMCLYVPPAFAHGFVVLSGLAEVLYKCTAEYSPENEGGIIWNDPDINISWPASSPVLSEKDRNLSALRDIHIS